MEINSTSPYALYSALELAEKATPDQISASYLALAKQFHPDRNGGDEARLNEIQMAYDVLSDANKKKIYDEQCRDQINRRVEEKFRISRKEERSAVYMTRNPRNIRKILAEDLRGRLSKKFKDVWSKNIEDALSGDIAKATNELDQKFENTPFEAVRRKLIESEYLMQSETTTSEAIQNTLQSLSSALPDLDASFWNKKLISLIQRSDYLKSKANSKENDQKSFSSAPHAELELQREMEALHRHILQSWREEYEKKVLKWMLGEIESAKQQIYIKYQNLLNNLRQIKLVMGNMPGGSFWNLDVGNLTQGDIAEIIRWGKFIQENPQIQELCDKLGHLNKEAVRQEKEKIRTVRTYEVVTIDCNSKEEIVGISLGNSIENALPQELALLNDPDVSALFDLKFIEHRLMCFEKQGYASETREENVEEEKIIEKKDKKGPIIICVDTSGSMAGTPEAVAKAITLTMASNARNQGRKCYLISYSTSIETFDFTPPKGIGDLIRFLKIQFHGGTDVMPALSHGIEMMQRESYKKADLLVVSDFIFPTDDVAMQEKIQNQKKNENFFYALSIIDNKFGANDYQTESKQKMFDEAWSYSPIKGNFRQLYSRITKIFDREKQGS